MTKTILGVVPLIIVQVCLIGALDLHDATVFQNSTLLKRDKNLNSADTFPANNSNDTLNTELLLLTNNLHAFVRVIQEGVGLEHLQKKTMEFNPNLQKQISDVNNEINEMKDEVQRMKRTIIVDDEFIRTNLNELEAVLVIVQIQFDNGVFNGTNNLQEFIDQSMIKVNYIRQHFERVKMIFDEAIQQREEHSKLEIIFSFIRSYRCNDALRLVSLLNGKEKNNINYVVHKLYNNMNSNFYRILEFIDDCENVTLTLAIYQALNYEMENNENNDYTKILELIKSLRSNVIKYANSSDILEEAEAFRIKLHKVAKRMITFQLETALKNNDNFVINEICENIHLKYPVLFNEVLQQVLRFAFDKIDVLNLIEFFNSHIHLTQSLLGYSNIFKEFKKRNLNQTILVDLALGLKSALLWYNNSPKPLDKDGIADSELKQLISDMPKSLKNLAVASFTCLKNVKSNGYLYVANDNTGRSRVFVSRNQRRVNEDNWIVYPSSVAYIIQNYKYQQYLYATTDYYSSNYDYRHVRALGQINNESSWIFEPVGDNLYIKSAQFDEYLFTDVDTPYNSDSYYVFTRRHYPDLWELENCNYMHKEI